MRRSVAPMMPALPAIASPPPRADGAWLGVLVVAVFARACGGEAVYDDALTLDGNAALRTDDLVALVTAPFFREHLAYWRPLTSLLLWAGHQLGIAGVHAIAVLAHAGAAWLAHGIAARVLGDRRRALLAAAVFALHPVQVEGVAWASALAAPVCAGAVLACVRSALAWADGRRRAGLAVAGAALAAVLAWEAGVVAVPLAAAAIAARPERLPFRGWGALAAIGTTVLVAWLGLRALVFGGASSAVGTADAPGWDPVAALELFVRPLGALLSPGSSSPFAALEATAGPLPSATVALFVGLVAAAAFAAVWWVRRDRRALLPVALVALPLALPVLAQARLGDFPLADRYLSLPAFGLGLAAALALPQRRGAWLAATAVAVAAAVVAGGRVGIWRDQAALVGHGRAVAPIHPTVAILVGNLAIAAYQDGDAAALPRARQEFALAHQRLLAARAPARERLAAAAIGAAWCRLFTQQELGAIDDAPAAAFRAALRHDERDAAGWVGLGVALALAGRREEALPALQRATALDPTSAPAWFNLGNLHAERGDVAAARAALAEALRWQPELAAASDLLARLR